MKFKLTASAVLCAALISGCSTAPQLVVPDGEWEDFTQQYQPAPPQPMYAPVPVAPVQVVQGPTPTVYTPDPVVAFTPPAPLPGSTPVKPAAASVVLPVSEKTIPQAPPVPPVVNPPGVPVPPALTGSNFGMATAPANQSGAVGAKPAGVALAKVDPVPPKPPKAWPVSPQDKTIRETLAKWAVKEGWTFNPIGRDYWTVSQDFDVVASDTFHGDFKDVVRRLVASTEMTKTPLQPCFYSNRAVRIVGINEDCSPHAGAKGR